MGYIPNQSDSALYCGKLAPWITAQMGLRRYNKRGCCVMMGTYECITCAVSDAIPRTDCDPPNECPECPQRAQCPCGNDTYRLSLLKSG